MANVGVWGLLGNFYDFSIKITQFQAYLGQFETEINLPNILN